MESVPDLPTTVKRDAIYNAACVYGRAVEATADAEKKQKYMDRGIVLLRESVVREGGFDDAKHFLADNDLNSFHKHETWESLVAKVRTNEARKPATP